jgi:hypothetical protein
MNVPPSSSEVIHLLPICQVCFWFSCSLAIHITEDPSKLAQESRACLSLFVSWEKELMGGQPWLLLMDGAT